MLDLVNNRSWVLELGNKRFQVRNIVDSKKKVLNTFTSLMKNAKLGKQKG